MHSIELCSLCPFGFVPSWAIINKLFHEPLTRLPQVSQICVDELCQHWFRWWLVTCLVPSHNLNQCWFIVNWTYRNKFQLNFNQNMKLFIHGDAAENIFCQMVAILSRDIQLKIIIHSLPVSHAWLYFSHAHTGFQTLLYFSHAHTGFQTYIHQHQHLPIIVDNNQTGWDSEQLGQEISHHLGVGEGIVFEMLLMMQHLHQWYPWDDITRADSRLSTSQWEMSLQSNAISHWLGANLESALDITYGKQPCNPVDYQSLTHWPLGNLNEILDM